MDMACHFSLSCCVKNYTYLHAGTLQKVLQQSSHFLPCLLRDLPHWVHLAVWTHINIFDHCPFFQICDCFLMMAVFPLIYWHLSNFKDTRTEHCVTSVSVPSDWNSQTWKERNKKKCFLIISNWIFILFAVCECMLFHDHGVVAEIGIPVMLQVWGMTYSAFHVAHFIPVILGSFGQRRQTPLALPQPCSTWPLVSLTTENRKFWPC